MKHGISPTTPRNRRWEKHTIVHLSKALVQRFSEFKNGKIMVQYLPAHLPAPPGAMVQIVVAPDRGVTYKRTEAKLERPGLRRRYALSGRELSPERLGFRVPREIAWSNLFA